MQIFLSEEQM